MNTGNMRHCTFLQLFLTIFKFYLFIGMNNFIGKRLLRAKKKARSSQTNYKTTRYYVQEERVYKHLNGITRCESLSLKPIKQNAYKRG